MPYDPAKPVEGTLIDAVEMRSQFTGLHDEIDALAADSVTQAQHANDLVNTENAAVLTVLPLTSNNTNGVSTLSITSGDFATQTIIEKINEMLTAARR